MKIYYVEYEEKCQDCNGDGIIQHPEWSQYWQETGGYRDLPMSEWDAADDKWWAEHGYKSSRDWPPEEVECDACFGSGIRRGRVSLADALAAISGG